VHDSHTSSNATLFKKFPKKILIILILTQKRIKQVIKL